MPAAAKGDRRAGAPPGCSFMRQLPEVGRQGCGRGGGGSRSADCVGPRARPQRVVFVACAHVWVRDLRYIFRPFMLAGVHAHLSSHGPPSKVGRDPEHPQF